ncbi:mechanosensitive ion channel family protein [Thermodesulfobacteriota bacterium]
MDFSGSFMEFEIVGNKLWRIIALFVIIFFAFVLGKIAKHLLQKSATRLEGLQREIFAATFSASSRGVVFLCIAFGISLGLAFLELKSKVAEVSETVSAILISIGVGYFLFWMADVPSKWFIKLAGKTESKFDDMLVPVIRKSLRVTIIILVLVQVAQILSDKPITSIIAGLGIGGLAFALAAQDTVKNFFGSIVLLIDKPFEIGDRVVVEGHDGPVETVGFRSTKIRTLDGHLVTVPNGQLANQIIKNIAKRPFIKRTANLTITYDTPPEKIDRALEIVKELLDNHEGMDEERPPRIFFNEFNADSLNIMVIYWYHPPNYWDFMAFSEKFNKEVFRRFNEEHIDFAFPTQTVYLAGDPSRPLDIGIKKENA